MSNPCFTSTVPRWRLAAALALAVAAGVPAVAATGAVLTGRTSVNYFYYFGGFAIDADEGHDGWPVPAAGPPWVGVPVTGLAPATLAIAGSDYELLDYLSWHGYLTETWQQQQTYSFGNVAGQAVLHAAGASQATQDSEICNPATGCGTASELHRSTNTQALTFMLDGPASYQLVGTTSGGQFVNLERWNETFLKWDYIVYGGVVTNSQSFSLAGPLTAGLFRVSNSPSTFSGGGPTNVDNAWTYDLTLVGAMAAVPEPAAGLMAAAGLATLLLSRRRRSQ